MTQNDRIAAAIHEYDGQGWHRTGTTSDVESAHWLADKARAYAPNAELESVGLSRIDLRDCHLEAESRRAAGLPLFDGGFTDAGGIRGRLGAIGSDAEIGLLEAGPGEFQDTFDVERKSPAHAAYVVVTRGGSPGLACRNAPRFLSPFGPPTLQVGSEERDWLDRLARRRAEAHFVASVKRAPTESYNVVAKLRGRNPSLQPLMVMTPRSGWWHCAAERGGGIACWLEVMRRLANAGPARDVIFVATTGHELGLLGIHAFLEQRPRLVDGSVAWMHFGASIGAAKDPGVRLGASNAELEHAAQTALARHDAPETPPVARGEMVGAESNVVHGKGARCVALAGGHAYFHIETDRWPHAVNVGAVARYANAFADVAVDLAG